MLSMEVYQFSPPSTYATLQPIVQSEPEEDHQVVWGCCCTRVVEFMDDIIEIADDKRSSLSESMSLEENNLQELESQSDEENAPPVNWENMNTIPIPPPLGNPPPYAVRGQCAV